MPVHGILAVLGRCCAFADLVKKQHLGSDVFIAD